MRVCRGLVAKKLKVVEAVGRVGIGQDMTLEDAWLITDDAPCCTDGGLRERTYVLRLDIDRAEIAYLPFPFEHIGQDRPVSSVLAAWIYREVLQRALSHERPLSPQRTHAPRDRESCRRRTDESDRRVTDGWRGSVHGGLRT
jgi:hypothetical protein